MKKLLKIVMSLLVVVALVACSGDSNSLAGTYELTRMEVNGQTVTSEDALWQTATSGQSATMELKSDGSCSVALFGETGDGSYEVKDSTVTITIDNDPQEFKLEDGNLTVELSGVKMVFEKK